MATYFYDQQIRRFLLQFARIFSNFEVEYGLDSLGNQTYIRIPIRYGDATRHAQTILQDNSASSLPSTPMMSFYINALKYDRPRIQAPNFVDTKFIKQREWDEASQTFEQSQGNAFTVERPMPIPYELGISLDIWTSNTNMKFQTLEQILTLFNPSLEIQSTDNYLDWTSLTVLELDNVNWSSRQVPNNDGSIDIATLKFSLPIWLSPPARVTKDGFIHKVIASMYDANGVYVDAINNDDLLLGTRVKITPHGYQVLLIGDELQILPKETPIGTDSILEVPIETDSALSWNAVIDEYGVLNPGITQIRLEDDTGQDIDIIGTVEYDELRPSILKFTIDADTLNSNTLSPIDAVINPLTDGPNAGLAPAAVGQRYLMTENTGDIVDPGVVEAWKGTGTELVAAKNDIVEYNGTAWTVVYTSLGNQTQEYVTNTTTSIQFKTVPGGWVRSYEGVYNGGHWGIVI